MQYPTSKGFQTLTRIYTHTRSVGNHIDGGKTEPPVIKAAHTKIRVVGCIKRELWHEKHKN